MMKIPSLEEAQSFLAEAGQRNPGPWVAHSGFVSQAAGLLAGRHPHLDPDVSAVLGLLHDIGRRAGVTGMRHALDGYLFLREKGYDDAARICITHSFPVKSLQTEIAKVDCTELEYDFMNDFLMRVEYDDYDRLIQLCDCISLPSGFCLMEKRLIDVSMRYGVNEFSVSRWKAYLAIVQDFEKAIGQSIYRVLPDVVENTFGSLCD
jgi:hypothetical protein